MKRSIFTLLLACSLVSASISPVAADDFTIEMQSQDIAFDEPAFAEETPVVEDVAEFEEEDVSNEEDSAAGFEEEDNEEDKTPSDDIVVEDSYDEYFAGEDEALADTQVENEELAAETANLAEGSIPIDAAHFPDSVFRNYIMDEIDDGDGYLSEEERYNVSNIQLKSSGVSSLAGLEYFENLSTLDCSENQLTSLDVSKCTILYDLNCSNNQLTSLDLGHFENLVYLDCSNNQLTSLNVNGCTRLFELDCRRNRLSTLDVNEFADLSFLDCSGNQLLDLDVTQLSELRVLYCSGNQLTSLDVSSCSVLYTLDCGGNQLTSLDLSECIELFELNCGSNQLANLDVSQCTEYLTKLSCGHNQLTSLDVSQCMELTELNCNDNQLTSLMLRRCSGLEDLYCYNNQLTSLDVSDCYWLRWLHCDNNQLTRLDISNIESLQEVNCNSNRLTSLNVSNCNYLYELVCYDNQLTSLDVSQCTALCQLYCDNNQLAKLDISSAPKLIEVYLEGSKSVYDDITSYRYIADDDWQGDLHVDNTTEILVGSEHEHIPQVSIPAKAATCTKAGKTAEEKCSVCGEILTTQETIPALGHKWGKWKTTKAATTTAEGKKTRTCSRCGAKETRAIAKLPKKANPITVKSKSPSVSKTARIAQTIKASDAFTIKNAQGTVTFKKKSGSSGKLSINSKTGLITVKKGTEKGTYKIVVAVTAAGNKQHKAGTKTVTVKVKVK